MKTIMNKYIMYSDYIRADTVMMSPSTIRDRLFHRDLAPTEIKKKDRLPTVLRPLTKQYLISKEKIESSNIQLMIQNNEKLISFLSSIKIRVGIESVIFVHEDCICVIIKPQSSHPVLVMKFPIDDLSVYARSKNLIYELPLADLFTKTTSSVSSSNSSINGYALYYENTNNQLTLHYEIDEGLRVESTVSERNMDYINLILQPSTDELLTKASLVSQNLNCLDSISLMMLVKITYMQNYKDLNFNKSENTIEFQILPSMNKEIMKMIITSPTGSKVTKTLVEEENSLIWNFQSHKSFKMTQRGVLLLQSVNNKIKSSVDHLYFAFGRYGQAFIFMKLITSNPIVIQDSIITQIQLNSLVDGMNHIYEMYYCY